MGGNIERNVSNVSVENNTTSPEVLKTEPAQTEIRKTKEKLTPLSAEIESKKLLDTAELDYPKSLKLVAEKLGVENVYNEKFTASILKYQKDNGLSPDGILGVITLSSILIEKAIFKGGDVFIELSKNKDLIEFNKKIKEGNVTDEDLKKYENILIGKMDNFLDGVKNKKLGKANDLATKNYTALQMLYLMGKFENKYKNDKKYEAHFKRVEEIEKKYKDNPTVKSMIDNPMNLIGALNISKEEAQRLGISLSEDGTIAPIEKQGSGNIIKTLMSDKSWSEKLQVLSGSALGWLGIIFMVWKEFGFSGIMMGAAGLVAGSMDGITPKSLAKMLGEKLDEGLDPAKVDAAKATTSKFVTDSYDKVAETLGVGKDKVEEAFSSKNDAIKITMNSEKGKKTLDNKKIDTVLEISSDENFKKKTTDNILDTKISELSKEIREKFNTDKITEKSPEYKEYLRVLKKKMIEAKGEDSSIKTVGDYFKSGITADQISTATGVGLMGLSLITKSVPTFLIGATAVGAGLYGAWKKFFDSDSGKSIVSDVEKTISIYTGRIESKIKLAKIPEEIKTEIYNKIKSEDFKGIKDLSTDPKVIKILEEITKYSEENYYKGKVEGITERNFLTEFLSDIYDTGKEYGTELTDNYEKRKTEVEKGIQILKDLKKQISKSGLTSSKQTELNLKLDGEILNTERELENTKLKQNNKKLEDYNEAVKDYDDKKNNLEQAKKDLTKLQGELSGLSGIKQNNKRIEINDKEIQINKLEGELKIAKSELAIAKTKKIKTAKENFDLKGSEKTITDSVTALTTFSTATITTTNSKEIKDIFNTIESLKEESKNGIANLYFDQFEKLKTGIEAKVKGMKKAIINKITINLVNFPENEIKKYGKILDSLSISKIDFENSLKAKKTEVFNAKVSSASIEEIQILRSDFGDFNTNGEIKKKVKKLILTDTGGSVEGIKKLIESSKIGEDDLDENEKNTLMSSSIVLLYKELSKKNPTPFNNRKNIINKIKELYKGFDFESIKDINNPAKTTEDTVIQTNKTDTKPDQNDSISDKNESNIRDMWS
ncbi:MAG: hypothetical protein Q9M94_07735 [Candidatus Gracilibacteria bacterium]|nr:hypothetical protein [Candidatus Gracilibacteria bacterium]MDQ7021926.1 hypothetical protein [Candidatus Gracilibacteria bacterium]